MSRRQPENQGQPKREASRPALVALEPDTAAVSAVAAPTAAPSRGRPAEIVPISLSSVRALATISPEARRRSDTGRKLERIPSRGLAALCSYLSRIAAVARRPVVPRKFPSLNCCLTSVPRGESHQSGSKRPRLHP